MRLEWDENKRRSNLLKHGLDFADAFEVLESHYRLDLELLRNGEWRTQSFSYAMGYLAVLTLVHLQRRDAVRIISFRFASEDESKDYHDWLKQESS